MKNILLLSLLFCAFAGKGQEARLVLPVGHTNWINSLILSPDGNYIVTSSDDKTARIWEAITGKELIIFQGHTLELRTAVFSTDNKFVLTASNDKTARIWEAKTGKELIIFQGHTRELRTAVFSTDNKFILTASYDKTARIWDAVTGKELFSLQGHTDYVNSAIFSSDNKLVLTTSWDSSARIWDASTGKENIILQGHNNIVNSAVFSSDNKLVLTSSRDSTARIWEVSTGKELFRLEGHMDEVYYAVFSSDNKFVLTTSRDNIARIWDSKTGKEQIGVKSLDQVVNSAVINNCNKFVLTTSPDNTLHLWDAVTGQALFEGVDSTFFLSIFNLEQNFEFKTKTYKEIINLNGYTNEVKLAVLSSDQKFILSVSDDYSANICDFSNGKVNFTFQGHTGYINSAIFSLDNKLVLTSSLDSTARIWEAATGKELFTLQGNEDWVNSAVLSSDNRFLLTSSDRTVRICDTETGKEIYKLQGHTSTVNSAAFSSDNKFVLTASLDYTARIWDAVNGMELTKFKGHRNNVTSAIFSSDDKFVLTASWDNTARIWDVVTGKELVKLKGHTHIVNSAVFSSDDKYVLTASWDNTARIWDAVTGKELVKLIGHTHVVNSAVFSSDDKFVLTASADGIARIWETANGNELFSFKGHSTEVYSAFFSFDNKYVLTTGSDHKTILWDATSGRALYTRLQLKNNDWLVYDEHYRYDGSQGARDYLYFVCGLEVVDLAQVKDALYVPNLVQRIMNGENLDHLPKLKDLEICGLTPEVEPNDNKKDGGYFYNIKARKGGVGKVEIYINGMLRQTVESKNLTQKDGVYELKIDEKLIQQYQIADKETELKVIARTADNKISSRGAVARTIAKETVYRKPSLHAIMVGIDDYKGEGLDLNYAAKDAIDLQTALKISTQKLFNVDDTNRVHFYNLTLDRSGNINGLTPDRNNILKTLEKIEKESKPEDVFLLFFAGHGEINPEKQLILLTAEASKEQAPNYSGIMMKELLEKLAKIPAGKRILLLDACHSGAAINELNIKDIAGVRDGEDAEKQSQRLKELENLASKSGLSIITASSTDQKALELPQYEHGLMTYALLTTMLNDPEVLDKDNNLQLEDWLRQTEKNVSKLIENQSAQRFVPINFSLGKVDEEVRKSIVLQEIPTVVVANVMNLETGDDDQDIKTQLIKKLNENSTRGGTDKILIAEKDGPNAISVNLSYELIEGKIKSKITLKKDKKVFKQFNFEGIATDLNKFVEDLSKEITKNLK